MEVRKVNTPSGAYQGSGPEVAVKPETPVRQETVQSSVPKTEKKEAKPKKPVFAPKADMKQSSQGSVIKTENNGPAIKIRSDVVHSPHSAVMAMAVENPRFTRSICLAPKFCPIKELIAAAKPSPTIHDTDSIWLPTLWTATPVSPQHTTRQVIPMEITQ